MEHAGFDRARADQLEREITDLRASIETLRREPRRLKRPRRRTIVAAVLFVILSIPPVVLASHRFTDVPTNSTFHTNISNIAQAGITTGCAVGKYCPTDPVRRDQMAAFLNRGLGRGAYDEDGGFTLSTEPQVIVDVNITVPGAGFVFVTTDGMGFHGNATGCPCTIEIWLRNQDDTQGSYYYADMLDNATGDFALTHVGTNYLFVVPSGGTYTYEVVMARSSGTANVTADASVTAIWLPFGQDGGAYFPGPTSARPANPQNR